MGQDISTSLDALIAVLLKTLDYAGKIRPEYTGGSDIASKIMYISKLFEAIYSEGRPPVGPVEPVS